MAHEPHNVLEHPEVQVASTARYLGAFALAFALVLIACLLVVTQAMGFTALVVTISVFALIAILAQLYLLFKLDLSATRVWLTVSVVFTVPLFFMAVTLTLWTFHTLALRTALTGAGS